MAAKKICLERLAHKFPTVSWRTIWSRATHGKWQILRSWLERFNKVFICPQLITCSYLQYWSLYRTHSIIFLTSEHFAVWATMAPSSPWGLMLLRSFIAFICSRIGIVCIRQWFNRLKIYVIFWGFSLWLSFFLFIFVQSRSPQPSCPLLWNFTTFSTCETCPTSFRFVLFTHLSRVCPVRH